MNKRIIRLIILILQTIATIAIFGICVYGIFTDSHWLNHVEFTECAIRLICISAFSVFYYHSLAGGFGSDTLFIPVFILFSVLTESRIINIFSKVFSFYFLPPLEIVNIFIFSTIMTVLPLIGYCIFFDNPSSDSAMSFLLAGKVGSIIVTDIVPKTQNLNNIFDSTPVLMLIYAAYIIAFITCIIMLFTDSPGSDLIRHFVCLILIAGNYINLFYNTFVMNIIGTVFIIVACTIIVIMTKKNAIKM